MRQPKVAIVCDWLVSRGGAERVISALAQLYPQAPIYTSIYNPEALPEFSEREVITSYIQKLPFAKSKHHLYLPLMPTAFEQFDLSEYDIVISSCHSCAKGVITKPRTLHISYCHSPMRYLWDSWHEYFANYGINPLLRSTARHLLHKLRIWDRLAADRVDKYLTNSRHVQERIQKYYRRESEVIYPPVETQFAIKPEQGQYYLAVGRLAPYKRFDLVVDAFNELQLPLVIVGTGKEEAALKKRAGRFTTFVGQVSDSELREIYSKATAFIFPQLEDFGITPLEAMSSGKPVIAYGKGGALETIEEGISGLFFEEQTPESLKEAVIRSQKINWQAEKIQKHVERFSRETFERAFSSYVSKEWEEWKKTMA
ncbi:glycosyltransferase family 4 protein [Candidatus Peregrinibacteria bacterium CG_4_9_14_0_2_um_filter_53_11]|nr:MAG: glycosyltransferase family 4 protein [Candidatus Peregrinibacteria bacterium CG_4_9_14_0_2_um_filter_53_11]